MGDLEDKIINNIDGPGIYFVGHVDNYALGVIKHRLKKTVIGVLNCDNKRLAIEFKVQPEDEQELANDFAPFTVSREVSTEAQYDMLIDSEKFLRCLFMTNSKLSKRYIILIDASILGQQLKSDDNNLVSLRAI